MVLCVLSENPFLSPDSPFRCLIFLLRVVCSRRHVCSPAATDVRFLIGLSRAQRRIRCSDDRLIVGFSRFQRRFRFSSEKVDVMIDFLSNILVFLPPLGGRTFHPRFPEVLAHGFSPALLVPSRVGSSTFRGGWALASLIC